MRGKRRDPVINYLWGPTAFGAGPRLRGPTAAGQPRGFRKGEYLQRSNKRSTHPARTAVPLLVQLVTASGGLLGLARVLFAVANIIHVVRLPR
jgi:hypothetical protein